MHVSTVAAAALLSLVALTPADANAQSRAQPYRAVGTEPFWSLTIDGPTIRFEAPDRAAVVVPAPKPIIGFAGEIYQTRRINVNIVHKGCSDGMSDRSYHDTVQVSVDGRQFRGCGGEASGPAPTPASPILGEWRAQSIAGRPPVRGTEVTVTFRDGRISGNTGCNAFGGEYKYVRGTLTAGPMISTKRACTRLTNVQEQTLLGLFGDKLFVSQNRQGKLIIVNRRGQSLVLVPARGWRR